MAKTLQTIVSALFLVGAFVLPASPAAAMEARAVQEIMSSIDFKNFGDIEIYRGAGNGETDIVSVITETTPRTVKVSGNTLMILKPESNFFVYVDCEKIAAIIHNKNKNVMLIFLAY